MISEVYIHVVPRTCILVFYGFTKNIPSLENTCVTSSVSMEQLQAIEAYDGISLRLAFNSVLSCYKHAIES